MLQITVIAPGRMKKGPLEDLSNDYLGKIRWSVALKDFDTKKKEAQERMADEEQFILRALDPSAARIVLDERGKSFKSRDFASRIDKFMTVGHSHIQFILGGADGLTDKVRAEASLLMSFGVQTWPHMLARVMLLEQVYRAQQILSGHPYHRD